VEHHRDYHYESQYSENVNFDEKYVERIRILRKVLRKRCDWIFHVELTAILFALIHQTINILDTY